MSGHAQHPWYKRYPSNFLAGTRGLRPILHKTYTRLIDGYYEYGGPLPYDQLALAHLLELRPQDVPRLLDELVEAGKIEIIVGFIHNKRTDIELGKMNGVESHWKATDAPLESHSAPTDEPVKPQWRARKPKKTNENYARAHDHPRDHAHPVPEAEAEKNRTLPQKAESSILPAPLTPQMPDDGDPAFLSPFNETIDRVLAAATNGSDSGSADVGSPDLEDRSPSQPSQTQPLKPTPALLRSPLVAGMSGLLAASQFNPDEEEPPASAGAEDDDQT